MFSARGVCMPGLCIYHFDPARDACQCSFFFMPVIQIHGGELVAVVIIFHVVHSLKQHVMLTHTHKEALI